MKVAEDAPTSTRISFRADVTVPSTSVLKTAPRVIQISIQLSGDRHHAEHIFLGSTTGINGWLASVLDQ